MLMISCGLPAIKSIKGKDISEEALKGIGHRNWWIGRKRESQYKSVFSSLGKKEKDRITIRKCGVAERFWRRNYEFCFKARLQGGAEVSSKR